MSARGIDPDHAADRRQRARLDRRRDGDDDLPHRAFDGRARRHGLLRCALRRERRDGRAGASRCPFHLGSVPHAMETLLAKWGDRMRPGDVFVMNDPFDGGIHLQDIFVFKPVFLDETLDRLRDHDRAPRRRRRAAAGLGRVRQHRDLPGGHPPAVAAALRPGRAGRDGVRGDPRERAHPAHDARRSRRAGGGDDGRRARAAGARAPVRPERLAELMTGLIDHTERLVRQEIASWPDGSATFTDYLDSDGIERRDVPHRGDGDDRRRRAHRRPAPSRRRWSRARSTRRARSSRRASTRPCARRSSVEIPNTSGAFRPIHVLTKPGTVCEVVMPGASSMRGVTGFRALDAINGALAQLIPSRVPAAGEGGNTLAVFGARAARRAAQQFIFYELVVGTWGGTPLGRRQRRPDEPGEPRGEHPGRGRGVGVPDPGRALRARARLAAGPAGIAAASRSSASGGA